MISIPREASPFARRFPRAAGLVVGLFGALVILSWHAHWRGLVQIVATSAPMQYTTALSLAFEGLGLALLARGHLRRAIVFAAGGAVFPLFALAEYAAHRDLGVDQLLFKPYFEFATAYPGRMSPLAAVCFVLTSACTGVAATGTSLRLRLTFVGILACAVSVVGIVAIFGFLSGINTAYTWGSNSGMAINTAAAFVLLGAGLLAWASSRRAHDDDDFLRWIPVSGALTLMVMIIFVSVVNTMSLKRATFWRRHTIEVILKSHAFEDNLTDLQRGARGYTTLGDTSALASFLASAKEEPALIAQLAELTKDNPTQQRRLAEISTAIGDLLTYDRRQIGLYDRGDLKAVGRNDTLGESRTLTAAVRDLVRALSQEEQQLLYVRDASEQTSASNGNRLLIFSSVMASLVLLAANYIVGYEMRGRRRAEIQREALITELRRAIEEVKTLSGMIPICGWCKSIRSDQGYWQSVEQYVRAHTDATFTHGICPSCEAKFKADLEAADEGAGPDRRPVPEPI